MKNIVGKIIGSLKAHYLIAALSLLLTFIIFAPQFAFPIAAESSYQGININHFGIDAHFYLTRAREVLDGHSLGSPTAREGKSGVDAYHSYSDYILLAPVKLLGLEQKVNIVALYNIYNFFGVFFLILLIYAFAWRLSREKLLSAAAALFVVGGYSIIFHKAIFYDDSNVYMRAIYPYFSSLILFAYLNLLVKSLKGAGIRLKIFAGLAFGLMFYVYFHAWSFVLALNACLFFIFIFKKDFYRAKNMALISLIGLLFGSYNLISLFSALGSAYGGKISYFMWMSYGHGPIFSKVGLATLVLFAWYFYKERSDKNLPFILAAILAGWAALNQQIITGRTLQYGHYYWYFIVPLSIVIGFYMVWRLIRSEALKKYLFALIILVVFINTAGGQYKSYSAAMEYKKYEQNFRPLIDYLNQDKKPGVILAQSSLNEYLFTIYTPHDLFWSTYDVFGENPIPRMKDALFIYSYLNKNSRNDLRDYLARAIGNPAETPYYRGFYLNLEGYWSGLPFYEYSRKIENNEVGSNFNRPALIEQLSREYDEAVTKAGGIEKLLKKYGVNYIVWDKNKNPEWDLSQIRGLKEVIASNNIFLYSFAD